MTQHSEQLDALAGALSAAQAEFVAIPKTDSNPFFKSKYAGLPQVVATASPILTKHGLSVSQHLGHDDGGDTLTTWLLHKSGQFICNSMRLHSAASKGLSEVQAQGSATTYARRYAYMAVLGLVADEDDDATGTRPAVPGPAQAQVNPELSDERITAVIEAIRAAGMPQDWVRMQMIGLGAEHVPEGQIMRSTIRGLTVEQAAGLIKVCGVQAKAREKASA